MKAYKNYYNEKERKIDFVEFDVDSEFDFTHDPETNLVDSDNGHSIFFKNVREHIGRLNKELVSGDMRVVKCKDCGRYFLLPKEEVNWFEDRNLTIPKRCRYCRNKRKREVGK